MPTVTCPSARTPRIERIALSAACEYVRRNAFTSLPKGQRAGQAIMFRLGHYCRAIANRRLRVPGLASSAGSSMCATCQKKLAMDAAVTRADGLRQASSIIQWSDAHGAFQGFESISNREMSETGRTVPDMNEPPSRYDVTLTVERDGNSRPDPAAFTEAANRAAWSRSASIISAHLADRIINIVTVIAPTAMWPRP